MMERIIEKTDDGSATLFVPELNEHYHSTKGHAQSLNIFSSIWDLKPLPPLFRVFLRSASGQGLKRLAHP